MITTKMADFIVDLNFNNLPAEVIEKARFCFLDFLGVTIRGSKSKSALALNKIINNSNEATVIGFGESTCLDSALANGVSAHSMDLDDGSRMAQLHPGACVIPAALSVCETFNKNGKEFISSMIAGYEIAIAIGILVNPEHRNMGFHSTGTCGTIGAAAAACKALNLNKNEIINALGLAGTQASGLLESDHAGSMGKHLHAGKAAQSGVLSALLAKEGFSGAKTIFEGNEGFLPAMADLNNVEELNIGKFHILNVYFKKYPVCRHLHSTIDAVLNIINKNDLKPDDIQKITVKTYQIAANHHNYHPKSIEAFRQSLPLSVAIAVKNGNLNLNSLKKEEDLSEISSKIIIEYSPNLDKLYPYKRSSEVTVEVDSKSYINRVDLPKGEPENQFPKHELLDKFYSLNNDLKMDITHIMDNLEHFYIKELMPAINEKLIINNGSISL